MHQKRSGAISSNATPPRGRPLIRAIKRSGPHTVAEPKFLLPVVILPEPLLGGGLSWPS
jgi:hypothetical protein